MESNKYYTPEIEEFHVGFEYEFRHEDYIDNGWKRYDSPEFNHEREDCVPFNSNKLNEFRVKYLDQSDIESLGWIDGELRGMTPFIFNEMNPDNEFQLYYQFDNQFAQIYNCHSQFVFQGAIKNKSELIKLMQQLNIK